MTLTSSQRFGCKFHLRSLSCVHNQSTSPLFYFFLLHRADETQSGRNNCARLQFLAFSLDCIMHVVGRRGGLMVKCARPRIKRSGVEPWPGTLCCVLGQDTLLSQSLSPGV